MYINVHSMAIRFGFDSEQTVCLKKEGGRSRPKVHTKKVLGLDFHNGSSTRALYQSDDVQDVGFIVVGFPLGDDFAVRSAKSPTPLGS